MIDYPKFVFKCGCILTAKEADPYRKLWRGRTTICPKHGETVEHMLFLCADGCGVEFIGPHRGKLSGRLSQACFDAKRKVDKERRKVEKASMPVAKTQIRALPEPVNKRPGPPIINDDPNIHPCRRCKIHLSGTCKSTCSTCHYCELRHDWADKQERRWG